MSSDGYLKELEEKYEDFKVYDRNGERIGKVDDLFVDESDQEEYVGVKLGFFGFKSTLIPMEIIRVNEADRRMEVSETKEHVRGAPTFSDDDDIDAAFEESVRRHFDLSTKPTAGSADRGSYGRLPGADEATPAAGRSDRDAGPAAGEPEGVAREADERDTPARGAGHGDAAARSTADRGQTGAGERFRAREEAVPESRGSTGDAATPAGAGEPGQESGRARVRRRVVREEIVEEDPPEQSR